jgi:hypothetical protein
MNFARIRPLTHGPAFHWFGYYDKFQFDPTNRFVLGMKIHFENRSPRPEDTLRIGMIDLHDHDRWIELDQTHAWCWQQGCMLQWRPGSSEIFWNDRQGNQFISCLLDIESGKKRTLPGPVYTLSPDGKTGYFADFSRINAVRPGYGYPGIPDRFTHELAPEKSGIWRIDLETEKIELIFSLADAFRLPPEFPFWRESKHYFNHLLVNPDGTRLEFLHRWLQPDGKTRRTRMLTCAPDGSEVRVIDASGLTSHFIWTDANHIIAWSGVAEPSGSFCRFDERDASFQSFGREMLPEDGHINCLPQNPWAVNDHYPDANHLRTLYLYNLQTHRRSDIEKFFAPPVASDEWRCDLHPRLDRTGTQVVIDSTHTRDGRQMYLLDISDWVGND